MTAHRRRSDGDWSEELGVTPLVKALFDRLGPMCLHEDCQRDMELARECMRDRENHRWSVDAGYVYRPSVDLLK